jgi:hypothetical protein
MLMDVHVCNRKPLGVLTLHINEWDSINDNIIIINGKAGKFFCQHVSKNLSKGKKG